MADHGFPEQLDLERFEIDRVDFTRFANDIDEASIGPPLHCTRDLLQAMEADHSACHRLPESKRAILANGTQTYGHRFRRIYIKC